jgi:hypothetical protein
VSYIYLYLFHTSAIAEDNSSFFEAIDVSVYIAASTFADKRKLFISYAAAYSFKECF